MSDLDIRDATPEEETMIAHITHLRVEREQDKARIATLEAEIKRLKAALVDCEHQTHCMRVWGGESWTYHPPQAGKIAKFARAALDA